jgi:hypothetical protein
MESNSQIDYEADPESFSETGQRLNHILDQIGFKESRVPERAQTRNL